MSKPDIGPNTERFAKHIEQCTSHIHFMNRDGKGFRERNHVAEARWYIAYHNARDMCETYKIKDWADCVLVGIPALTDETVGYYCHYIGDEDEQECWAGEPTRAELVAWFS